MDQKETADSQLEFNALLCLCSEWHEVGSRVTCDPPIMDTDRDILCVVDDWRAFISDAVQAGFTVAGSVPANELEQRKEQSLFTSLKRYDDNLIVTDDEGFAKRFLVATRLAKRFNLRLKDDRIALFQAVLYGNG